MIAKPSSWSTCTTAGGSYLNRMGDHCAPCRYRPTERLGDRACPFTTGCWAFVHRHHDLLAANHRRRAGRRRAAPLDRPALAGTSTPVQLP
ncbi:hypothetical protein ACFWJ4_12675 [Kitasatospora sp. NPDC127067]|uniref:hypothetical protein n=1 Tax=Kitasatospora sp. NPDC127067 TaxID=3347126 RepID=UPI003647991F